MVRKFFFLIFCSFAFAAAYGQKQDTVQSQVFIKEQLLQKARVQKIFGYFMVGTGVPVTVACLYFMTFPDDVIEKGKVALALAGSVAYTLVGIQLLKSGRRNKEKAIGLDVGLREVMTPYPKLLNSSGIQPTISLTLSFR